MSSSDDIAINITPQVLLKAYSCGIFPMAESADDPALYWIEPEHRGILPLDEIHISRRMKKTLRSEPFEICVDRDFQGVIDGCAGEGPARPSTWINDRIRELYSELFDMGHCHTIEAWADGKLLGGLYGVHLHGAFFGESMFSRARDASKVTLLHLVAHLIKGGFKLLDTQFVTEHLSQFGTEEVGREKFQKLLDQALKADGDFPKIDARLGGAEVVEIITRNHRNYADQ